MDLRELKALEIAARCKIVSEGGVWVVPSQSGNGKYRVTIQPASCTCDDFALRQQPCKHVIAAKLVQERDGGPLGPVLDTEEVPKRKTYAQAWPQYNQAQTEEKHRFLVLLQDLCRNVPQLPNPVLGPRRAPTADVVFSMVFKVYTGFSTRRFMCDLADAHAAGHVSQAIHYNSICRHFEMPELAPILSDLITRSSLPLRAVETTFAPDSTGFSVCRFVRWFDEKYGAERSGRDWVKVHLMTGTKTNIVVAAEIHGRDANDCPILPSLLNTTTAQGFTVKTVTADKGYSSAANLEAIAAAGAAPYIPFKENTTGAAGGLWEKMFHYYQFRREEFLGSYHARSNVESTISAIKRKFGDSVRAKGDVAMKNEALCKILAYNICVVIQSQIELGIEPVFWQNSEGEKAMPADVLPLVRPG